MFAWEFRTLEPIEYWKAVPPRIAPIVHFYNAPISADNSSTHSISRIIRELVHQNDFVSVKLDIDTPDVELPIAQELFRDSSLHSLVDEFFFELHFRCEVMMYCGWGTKIPNENHGFQLSSRYKVLKFFQDLRYLGVRAHIWP